MPPMLRRHARRPEVCGLRQVDHQGREWARCRDDHTSCDGGPARHQHRAVHPRNLPLPIAGLRPRSVQPCDSRRRVVAAGDRRVPPRGTPPHRIQHVRPVAIWTADRTPGRPSAVRRAVRCIAPLGRGRVSAVGASGAIFGLFGAWIAASYRIRHTPGGRRLWQQLIILLVINLALGFADRSIAWQAHLGGLVAGLVIVLAWQRLGRRTTPAARTAIAVAVGMVAVVAAGVALLVG